VIDEVVTARGGHDDLNARIVDVEGKIATNKSSIETIVEEIEDGRGSEASLKDRLDAIDADIVQEGIGRDEAITAVVTDLASTDIGKGASLVSIHDAGGKLASTNVEGAIFELEDRLVSVEETGGVEVVNARKSN